MPRLGRYGHRGSGWMWNDSLAKGLRRAAMHKKVELLVGTYAAQQSADCDAVFKLIPGMGYRGQCCLLILEWAQSFHSSSER